MRYAVYTVGLSVCLGVLPLTFLMVDISAGAPPTHHSVSMEPNLDGELRPVVNNHVQSQPAPAARFQAVASQSTPDGAFDPERTSERTSYNVLPVWDRWSPWIVVFYVAGVIAMLARLVGGVWAAHRLCLRAETIHKGPLIDLLRRVATRWSMRVVPTLARAQEIVVPKVVGLVRPTILLPISATTGLSMDQLAMILTHELAHVRRYDMWVNLLQRLAETVLFFNPAVWYISRRISTLREYCCDEMVCQAMSETRPQPQACYASALLRVAELGREDNSPQSTTGERSELAALAASGRSPSELRRRVAHLFGEPLREPLRMSRCGALMLVVLGLALVSGPAVWTSNAQTARQTDTKTVTDDNTSVKGRQFEFGGKVEVLGIGTHDENPQRWWDPQGKRLESIPFKWKEDGKVSSPDTVWRRVVFRIDSLPDDGHVTWKVAGSHASAGGEVSLKGKRRPKGYFTRYFGVAKNQKTFGLRIGVAAGSWKTVIKNDPSGSGAYSLPGKKSVVFSEALSTTKGTVAVVSHNYYFEKDTRVVAIDKRGKLHTSVRRGGIRAGKIYQTRPTFPNLTPDRIDRFEFQLRDYEWLDISDLPINPKENDQNPGDNGNTGKQSGGGSDDDAGAGKQGNSNPPAQDVDATPSTDKSVQSRRNDGSTQLAAAIREFNDRSRKDPIGKDQPPLTEDEVVAAILRSTAIRDRFQVTDEEFRIFQQIADTRRLPKNAELEVLTGFKPDALTSHKMWSVRIRMPKLESGGSYAFAIRYRLIRVRKIDEKSIAWGKKGDNGLTVGVVFDPQADKYIMGDAIRPRFFLRNDGKDPLDVSVPRLLFLQAKDIAAVDRDGKPITVKNGHKRFRIHGPTGWIRSILAPGGMRELYVPFNLAIGAGKFRNAAPRGLKVLYDPFKLAIGEGKYGDDIGGIIEVVAGQQCRIRFTISNFDNTNNEKLQTGELSFNVLPKSVPEAQTAAEQNDSESKRAGKQKDSKAPVEDAGNEAKPKKSAQITFPITVTGHAVDENGDAIAGAKIYLASPRTNKKPLAVTETDRDGAYRFEKISLPIKQSDTNKGRDVGGFEVFGEADGHGFAWRPLKRFYPGSEHETEPNWIEDLKHDLPTRYGNRDLIDLDLTFGKEARLNGRIVDDQGKPIANTKLAIRRCDPYWNQDDLSRFGSQHKFESLNETALVPPRIKSRVTDSKGRFEFDKLPENCRFRINVRPPGHPPRTIYAVTHAGVDRDAKGNRVYSGDFEVVFARPRTVKLRVVYGDTGEPAYKVGVGGIVTKAGFWETTDKDGLVEVPLPDGRYELGFMPRYRTPYLRTKTELVVSAETAERTTTIKLRPAAVVDITVLDADTGKPLPNVDVWIGKEFAGLQRLSRRVHGYRSWEVETRISQYERPRSDKNGKMRVLFEPGKHRIGVGLDAFPEGYEAVQPDGRNIECQPGKPVAVEFSLRRTAGVNNQPRMTSEPTFIVADHVMIHENRLITWDDIRVLLTKMAKQGPLHPSFLFTNGAVDQEKERSQQAYQLYKEIGYKETGFKGMRIGSISPRASRRYDAIQTPDDLKPDESKERDGHVRLADDSPVEGAEVILLPNDDAGPFGGFTIYLNDGRVRQPVEEILTNTNAEGLFTIYPHKRFQLVVLHKTGFALVNSERFQRNPTITLKPWVRVSGMIDRRDQPKQSIHITSAPKVPNGWPRIQLADYQLDVADDGTFDRGSISPGEIIIQRSIPDTQGTSYSLTVKQIQDAKPGSSHRITIGALTDEDRKRLNRLRGR